MSTSMRSELLRRRTAAKQGVADHGAVAVEATRAQQQRDASASLRRSTAVMQQELQRSAEVGKVLEKDKSSLGRTNTLQEDISSASSESKRRLTALQRKRRLELLGAFSGLCWFCACAAYVVLTRFFKVCLRDLGYWLLVLLVLLGAAGWQLKLKFLG